MVTTAVAPVGGGSDGGAVSRTSEPAANSFARFRARWDTTILVNLQPRNGRDLAAALFRGQAESSVECSIAGLRIVGAHNGLRSAAGSLSGWGGSLRGVRNVELGAQGTSGS